MIRKSSVFLVVLFLLPFTLAHGNLDELAEKGEQLILNNTSCADLNTTELEAIGEFIMARQHPDIAHEDMHVVMGIKKGTPESDAVHINLAQRVYCAPLKNKNLSGNETSWQGLKEINGFGVLGIITLAVLVLIVVVKLGRVKVKSE